MIVKCLRCEVPCQTGIPDPTARALVKSATTGFCPSCAITFFLLSIEPIRNLIEGSPARGHVQARPGKGPEILLAKHIRDGWQPLLSHTQLRPDEINWLEVYYNWGLPWPKGREPKPGNF